MGGAWGDPGRTLSDEVVSFSTSDVKAAYDKLVVNKVIVSLRENYIRVSPHGYNV